MSQKKIIIVKPSPPRIVLDPKKPKKKAISSLLIQQRMEALEKGDLNDCDGCIVTFLVGPEPDGDEIIPQLEMRACKFDLIAASEYFAGLLRSPFTPPGPIRVKHVDPAIFKLVIEYTHTCGQLVSQVSDLEQCLKLSAAADEFLLEGLGQISTELLERFITLDNVWKIFNENHMIKFTSSACEKLLSARTNECLEMPAFLNISEQALIKFLQLKEMKIDSEKVLVRACIKFVSGKNDERDIFRRAVLPHLRLLLLNDKELVETEITPFLNRDEKVFLSLKFLAADPLSITTEASVAENLCKERAKRNPIRIVSQKINCWNLLPLKYENILNVEKIVGEGRLVKLREATKFIFSFQASDFLQIRGFDILCPIDLEFFEADYYARLKSNKVCKWADFAALKISVNADYFEKTSAPLKPVRVVDSVASFETSILVPKNSYFKIEVIFNNPCCIRKVLISDGELVQFKQHLFRNSLWQESGEPTLSIFKCVYFIKVLK